MNKENCALKLVDEKILYYDARSKKRKKETVCFPHKALARFSCLVYVLLITTEQITEFTKSSKNDTLLEPAVFSCSPIPYYKQYQNPREVRFGGLTHNTSKATQERSYVWKICRQITDVNKIIVNIFGNHATYVNDTGNQS